jgi:hypothetical protein
MDTWPGLDMNTPGLECVLFAFFLQGADGLGAHRPF